MSKYEPYESLLLFLCQQLMMLLDRKDHDHIRQLQVSYIMHEIRLRTNAVAATDSLIHFTFI